MKKMVGIFLLMALIFTLCACDNGSVGNLRDPGATIAPEKNPNTPKTYTVTVTDPDGNGLEGVYVVIALGNDESYNGGQTNENGVATMEMPVNDDYQISLMAVPDEYEAEGSYTFTGYAANIVLSPVN